MIEQTIGKYRITRLIGEGGMAKVYEAEHSMLGTKVAIKILDPLLASDRNLKVRFRNEAKIMAALEHPNIVQVRDFEEDERNNVYAIVMELLEGDDLSSFIKNYGALSKDLAYDLMLKILNAFEYAHSKGLIHRDVKPGNIFITEDKNIKILDFGIAKIVGEQSAQLTHTGTQMGTPMYMSPEQVTDVKHIDKRSDIYSLGVMLYYMLTGKPPYNETTLSNFHIFNKIVNDPLFVDNFQEPFASAIAKATAKNREDRFVNCVDFNNAISINKISSSQAEKNGGGNNTKKSLLKRIALDIKKLSNPLTAKILTNKPWEIVEPLTGFQKLIFKRDSFKGTKELLVSTNGELSIGSWEYIKDTNSLILKTNKDNILFIPLFVNYYVLILKKDGTTDGYYLFANTNLLSCKDAYAYLKEFRNKELNIKEVKLEGDDMLEIFRYDYTVEINYGNIARINGNTAVDGIYMSNNNKYKFIIKNSRINQVFEFKKFKTVSGNEVIFETSYYSLPDYEKGDHVWIDGEKAPDGAYKIKGGRNIVVEGGKIVKKKLF